MWQRRMKERKWRVNSHKKKRVHHHTLLPTFLIPITKEHPLTQSEIIHDIGDKMPGTDGLVVMAQLPHYTSYHNIFTKSYIWTAINHTTSWWSGVCGWTHLSKTATAILNVPPTSAAADRSFSKHANTHSLQRNKQAAKLVYLAMTSN